VGNTSIQLPIHYISVQSTCRTRSSSVARVLDLSTIWKFSKLKYGFERRIGNLYFRYDAAQFPSAFVGYLEAELQDKDRDIKSKFRKFIMVVDSHWFVLSEGKRSMQRVFAYTQWLFDCNLLTYLLTYLIQLWMRNYKQLTRYRLLTVSHPYSG